MANRAVQEIIEQHVLTVAMVVEDKLDEEIAALDRVDDDDLEVLREQRIQQMKKMAEKRINPDQSLLVHNRKLIVQNWRLGSWPDGIDSVKDETSQQCSDITYFLKKCLWY